MKIISILREGMNSYSGLLWMLAALGLAILGNPIEAEVRPSRVQLRKVVLDITANLDGAKFPLALGSGLATQREQGESPLLWMVTDRGPNSKGPKVCFATSSGAGAAARGEIKKKNDKGDKKKRDKSDDDCQMRDGAVFLAPSFAPAIALIRGDSGEVITQYPIKSADGPATGLIPPSALGGTGELGLDRELRPIAESTSGLDPEAIAQDKSGRLWVAEEYGPSILQLNPRTGVIEQTLRPGAGLPSFLTHRQPNRGFESLAALGDGSLIALLQSPPEVSDELKKIGALRSLIPLVRYNPNSKRADIFLYDPIIGEGAEDVKVGDITTLADDTILLLQNEELKTGGVRARIIQLALSDEPAISGVNDITWERYVAYLAQVSPKVVLVTNVLVLNDLGWNHEKAEGLTILPDGRTLVVTADNDFGVSERVALKARDLVLLDTGRFAVKKKQPIGYAINERAVTELWFLTFPKPIVSELKGGLHGPK